MNRVAVVVEKDLSSLDPLKYSQEDAAVKLLEITAESLEQNEEQKGALVYPVDKKSENRRLKALHYLSKGYRGFALARGNRVTGDIWYVAPAESRQDPIHPDLTWLKIRCGSKEVYAFDMHLYPDQRGKNMAVLLQSGALHEMRKKGFTRAFGYYWAHYIPALWVHRTLRWKDVGRIKVSRFFFFRHYEYSQSPYPSKEPPAPGMI